MLEPALLVARKAAGCPSYWVVDPNEPWIVVWRLRGQEYVEVARAAGAEQVDVDAPCPLTIGPADLVD